MKVTYEQQLVQGLINLGYTEDKSYKGKYRKFRKEPHVASLFVGSRGALRIGRTASDSHSVGDPGNKTPSYMKFVASGALTLTNQ